MESHDSDHLAITDDGGEEGEQVFDQEALTPSFDEPAPEGAGADLDYTAEQSSENPPACEDASIAAEISALTEQIFDTSQRFDARIKDADSRIAELSRRVEQLQGDQVQALLKPVFVKLADLLTRAEESARSAEAEDSGYATDFEAFAHEVEALIDLYDIESVGAEVGGKFDMACHAVVRAQATEDREKADTIYRVQRQGLRAVGSDRTFLPARVFTYRFVEPPAEAVPDAVECTDLTEENSDV